MYRNIVICLDGTGNQIEKNISNVLKFYRVLEKHEKQIVYYDQGIGTLGRKDPWGKIRQGLKDKLLSMGVGIGLDKNVIRAYEFLIRNYIEGDKIYLFGFSRGAHTARALAGLLYEIGLLRPEQINLSGAALTAYKQSIDSVEAPSVNEDIYEGDGSNFRRIMKPQTIAIEFIGVWDTVSSILIPNYKNLFFPPMKREILPHTSSNPAVKAFRQAASIDERRRMFRLDHWEEGQEFKPNKHSQGKRVAQTYKQVWFAGVHADVGGGYPTIESGLSQFPLIWMIDEAKAAGIDIFDRMAKYVTGQDDWSATTGYQYPAPDLMAKKHKSLTALWLILEIGPKLNRLKDWEKRKSFLGRYLPLKEPRQIPISDTIAQSAKDKKTKDPTYKPVNF